MLSGIGIFDLVKGNVSAGITELCLDQGSIIFQGSFAVDISFRILIETKLERAVVQLDFIFLVYDIIAFGYRLGSFLICISVIKSLYSLNNSSLISILLVLHCCRSTEARINFELCAAKLCYSAAAGNLAVLETLFSFFGHSKDRTNRNILKCDRSALLEQASCAE